MRAVFPLLRRSDESTLRRLCLSRRWRRLDDDRPVAAVASCDASSNDDSTVVALVANAVVESLVVVWDDFVAAVPAPPPAKVSAATRAVMSETSEATNCPALRWASGASCSGACVTSAKAWT